MQKTAEFFIGHERQLLPSSEGAPSHGSQVIVRLDEQTGQITLTPTDTRTEQERKQAWDKLFLLLDEVPQEERDMFMPHRDQEPYALRDSLK